MTHKNTILIIGAGLAGLAAANYLTKHGVPTIVLEARNRAGGRIWVDKTLGVPLGRGAAWIHGVDGNPIVDFLSSKKDGFFPYNRNLFYSYNRSGERISEEMIKNFDNRMKESLLLAKKYAYTYQQDIALSSALLHSFNLHHLSSDEKDLFFKRIKYFENYVGDNYERLSARHWDEETVLPGEHGIIYDAYDSIIQTLAKNCHIQFNAIAQSIKLHNDCVEVTTNTENYYAQSVIVTVPLGVLKQNQITFYPDIPLEKKKAISKLGMGIFNIIAMRFPCAFLG